MAPKRDLWIRSQTVKRQKFEAVLSLTVRGDADATSLERTFGELSNLLSARTEEAVGEVRMEVSFNDAAADPAIGADDQNRPARDRESEQDDAPARDQTE